MISDRFRVLFMTVGLSALTIAVDAAQLCAQDTLVTDAVYSPRVVGEQRPDFHSLETFLASPRFAGKRDEALALAIYDYLTSPVDGVWHSWPVNESKGEPAGKGDVSDPVKLLNAYGWGICGQNAELLQGLYRAAGMQARIRGLPGHNVCEVFYDARWHVFDVDMRTWFRTPAGHIASVDELSANAQQLIISNTDKSSPCCLPDRSLEDYAKIYDQAKSGASIFPPWATRAHTMDFMLRPGECLIRSQTNEGRFHLPVSWKELMLGPLSNEWYGAPRERFAPFRTVGNGRWTYAPDLTAKTRDFELGVWTRKGLTQDQRGLAGPGEAVFRIHSPYPFCGVPDAAKDGFPARDGVRLALAGAGAVKAEITDAEGRWVEVVSTHGSFAVQPDLTMLLTSRYGAMIRLTLDREARLDSFVFDGSLMTAPLSLPRLTEGFNRMELRSLDKHASRTTPWPVPVDFRSEVSLKAALVRLDAGVIATGRCERLWIAPPPDGAARAVFRFDAPAGRRFAWAYAIATVPEGPTGAPPREATLEWSADGTAWKRFATITIPATPLQWDGSIDGESVPAAPLPALWFRLVSDTGALAFEFAGHLEETPSPAGLRTVHRWTEAGKEKRFEVPPGKRVYEIPCGAAPQAHTIEMRALSVPAAPVEK